MSLDAITICEPYATLIVHGRKPVENRRWAPPRKALSRLIAIHAGLSKVWLPSWSGPLPADPTFGVILGRAILGGWFALGDPLNPTIPERYEWLRANEHVEGPYCWVFDYVERFAEPIPCSGARGFWRIPERVSEAMRRARVVAQFYWPPTSEGMDARATCTTR